MSFYFPFASVNVGEYFQLVGSVMCSNCIVLEVPILSLGFAHLDAKDIPIFFFLGIDLLGLFICFSLFGETLGLSMSNTLPAFDVYAVPACLAGIDLFLPVRF